MTEHHCLPTSVASAPQQSTSLEANVFAACKPATDGKLCAIHGKNSGCNPEDTASGCRGKLRQGAYALLHVPTNTTTNVKAGGPPKNFLNTWLVLVLRLH